MKVGARVKTQAMACSGAGGSTSLPHSAQSPFGLGEDIEPK